MRAMILAAGLGTRLKPWTDRHPKALALVNGKPLLQRNVEFLQQHGIFDVIVNVHHFSGQLIEAIEHNKGWGSDLVISDESDVVLETGGGLKKAAWYLEGENFVLMNADILTNLNLSEMIEYHRRLAPVATLAVRNRKTSRYLLFDENDQLCGWQNIKTGEAKFANPVETFVQKAFSGVHIISPSIFPLIEREGKFSMVDVYLDLAASYPIRAFDHSSSEFIDVGKPESLTLAEQMFK